MILLAISNSFLIQYFCQNVYFWSLVLLHCLLWTIFPFSAENTLSACLMLLIADDLLYMLPSLTCALNMLPVHRLCILANPWYSRDVSKVWFQQRQVWLLDFGNFPLTSQAYNILFTYRKCTMDILLMFIPQAVGMFGNILWYWTQSQFQKPVCCK